MADRSKEVTIKVVAVGGGGKSINIILFSDSLMDHDPRQHGRLI